MFSKSVTAFLFAVLSAASAQECIWNTTHCACSAATGGGSCYRKVPGVSPSVCNVNTCGAGGYKCDCLGRSLCEIDTCSTWRPSTPEADAAQVGAKNVPCKLVSTASCLTKLETENKIVALGPKSDGNMFDMTWQTDKDDYLTKLYQKRTRRSAHDRWDQHEKLILRHLNFRLYKSDDQSKMFVCMIINTWGTENDGLGNYKARVAIKGRDGQTLSFKQCDDVWSRGSECKAPFTGNQLRAVFHGLVTHSDGFCVGDLVPGEEVSIKVDGVQKIEGINFLGSDGDVDQYFFKGGDGGLTGAVDDNGLVTNGVVPEIIINPGGIETD